MLSRNEATTMGARLSTALVLGLGASLLVPHFNILMPRHSNSATMEERPNPDPIQPPITLAGALATGDCNPVIAIWGENERPAAEFYAQTEGAPTDACPEPAPEIGVVCDSNIETGDRVGAEKQLVIRFRLDLPGFGLLPPPECQIEQVRTIDA